MVGTTVVALSGAVTMGLPVNQPILVSFSSALDITTIPSSITIKDSILLVAVDYSYTDNNKTVSIQPKQPLANNTQYTVSITTQIKGANKEEFPGLSVDFKTIAGQLSILSYKVGGQLITTNNRIINVPLSLSFEIDFSAPLNPATVTNNTVSIAGPDNTVPVFTFSADKKTLTITRTAPLLYLSKYTITVTTAVKGAAGEVFNKFSQDFFTGLGGHTSGKPAKTDTELLDLIQQLTFQYFWNTTQNGAGGHPASGMARERNTSGNTVTTGGSGFGIMAVIVGVERGFITRTEGIARIKQIVSFLEKADRFHGAWGHWMDGNTGHIIPFSPNDDGGDLVETSFLMEGLITFRQYLTNSDTTGNNLINRITNLYNTVEWDWYRNGGQNVLYWHWSPDKAWIMNFPLYGYFEEQITYFLAAASPTHSIPKVVYANGYGLNGNIKNGNTFTFGGEGHVLPLADPAPLFWVQYSYMGMDPHFTDDYANYWTQNVNASLINHAYCKANPDYYAGYSDACWGLTASDNPNAMAHNPWATIMAPSHRRRHYHHFPTRR